MILSNLPRLLIVIDGVAEDLTLNSPTSLELSNISTLNLLAKNSYCGEFSPIDPPTQKIKTDLIISNLLNIRPEPWPGRSYFELLYQDIPHDKISACGFIKNPFLNTHSIKSEKKKMCQFESVLLEQAKSLGFHVTNRPYSRLQRKFILWLEKRFPEQCIDPDIFFTLLNSLSNKLNISDNKRISLTGIWLGDKVEFKKFNYGPAFVAMAEGSLPGVCEVSGIELLSKTIRNIFDFSNIDSIASILSNAIYSGNYKTGIIYFKDTDWASHYGDRSLKIKSVEFFDKLLTKVIGDEIDKWMESILIVSDHRSNLDNVEPSRSSSIFAFLSHQKNNPEGFNERAIRDVWGKDPLSTFDLHNLFFRSDSLAE